MKIIKYMFLFLFALLSLYGEVEAKVILVENQEIEICSEHDFKEQTQEIKWLGLLYLEEVPTNQNQNSLLQFPSRSFSQNFSRELCLKSVAKNLESSFQFGRNSKNHLKNGRWNEVVFQGSTDLVDAWKVIEGNPILRKKPENLENISKWLDEGFEPQKLTDRSAKSSSKQNLIDQLGTAKSKFHAQVLIKDYDNIPGVAKGRYVRNGSKLSDKADLPSGWTNDVDLPAGQIENFTGKIEPLELKPGDRIFRVSSVNGGSGAYWTRVKPERLDDVVGGTAVQPQWNNFQYLYEYTVPDGITIKTWKGKTARQPVALKEDGVPIPSNYHLPGGHEQLFINYIVKQDPNFQSTVKSAKAEW
jgi:hypothetical protein